MGEHNTAFPTPTATLGHDQHPRRAITRSATAAAAGALSALVLSACTATGTGDVGHHVPPMRSDGTFWFIDSTEAGTWETAGSARVNGNDCSWNLFLNPPGEMEQSFKDTDWAEYQISRGDVAVGQPARVTLADGQFFTSNGCADWQRVD